MTSELLSRVGVSYQWVNLSGKVESASMKTFEFANLYDASQTRALPTLFTSPQREKKLDRITKGLPLISYKLQLGQLHKSITSASP